MSLYVLEEDLIPENPLTDKCIVLDLDETLVHTEEYVEWLRDLNIYKDPNAYVLRNRIYKLNFR